MNQTTNNDLVLKAEFQLNSSYEFDENRLNSFLFSEFNPQSTGTVLI